MDTNVLIDVFGADARFGQSSAGALRVCLNEGAVVACDVVWSEARAAFPSEEAFMRALRTLGVRFSPMMEQAATLAGAAWKKYRAAGGKRERVIADFLIGAHAASQCDRLLTRDRGYYKKHFARLAIIDPSP
ncbi:MAG: type II toxin-antitoxin system VapC family toxin [Betaproteobacteria bacterium]|nr:type II toxin-antitoxin system VapC family toxin [Betaproteobacteria bacterium]MBI2960823.1 type II toxin-antitoxin system VapC family toxin [Betaproteobacteria bacterium]